MSNGLFAIPNSLPLATIAASSIPFSSKYNGPVRTRSIVTSPLTTTIMDNPIYLPSLPTLEERQDKVLDILECLEEQAHEFARDMRTMHVTLMRLFKMQNEKVEPKSEEAE